jgi:hypothetical protein
MSDSEKTIRVDDASATTTYVGYAALGMLESEAFWKIKRLTTSGTVLKIEWADGDEYYDNIWANRASLTYR